MTTDHRIRPRLARAASVLACLAPLAACGDEAESSTPPEDGPTTVRITAVDYEFEGVPDTISSEASLELVNDSDGEVHEIVAILLPDGEDRSPEALLALPEDELDALFFGGPPALVMVAGPGEPAITAVGDGSLAAPGRYLLLCAIPTGADPEEYFAAAETTDEGPPQVDGGPPHFVQGMAAAVTVAG